MKAVLSFSCAALAALAVLAVLAVFSGCRRGQLTEAARPRGFPGVVSRDVSFYSSALDRNMTYAVYMPKDSAGGTDSPLFTCCTAVAAVLETGRATRMLVPMLQRASSSLRWTATVRTT
jgi:hypothetical protein